MQGELTGRYTSKANGSAVAIQQPTIETVYIELYHSSFGCNCGRGSFFRKRKACILRWRIGKDLAGRIVGTVGEKSGQRVGVRDPSDHQSPKSNLSHGGVPDGAIPIRRCGREDGGITWGWVSGRGSVPHHQSRVGPLFAGAVVRSPAPETPACLPTVELTDYEIALLVHFSP